MNCASEQRYQLRHTHISWGCWRHPFLPTRWCDRKSWRREGNPAGVPSCRMACAVSCGTGARKTHQKM